MPGIVAWATDGTGRAGASGDTAVVPGYDPSIMAVATSTYVGGVTTGCVAPTTISATSAIGNPVCHAISSSIVAINDCSVMSKGDP